MDSVARDSRLNPVHTLSDQAALIAAEGYSKLTANCTAVMVSELTWLQP